MILQALVQYYEDLLANDKITRPVGQVQKSVGLWNWMKTAN